MSLPGNGIFVVRGEMTTLMTAMRRGSRWNAVAYVDEEKDALMKLFVDLKQFLNRIDDLRLLDPNVFLAPFLEVIRTDETTGGVTSLALSSINKFLSYGLIDPTSPNLAVTVENIVNAVTHARFMGTDQSSDGVTLFRVVEVLHTLMRSPEGAALSNESVCEVMLSCFKICFETRLNVLLRRFAEQALKDMVLLLFMRLPQFSANETGLLKKFPMMAASMEQDKKQRKKQTKIQTTNKSNNNSNLPMPTAASDDPQSPNNLNVLPVPKNQPLGSTPLTSAGNILDMQGKITQTPTTALGGVNSEEAISTPTTTTELQGIMTLDLQPPEISIVQSSPLDGTTTTQALDQQTPTCAEIDIESLQPLSPLGDVVPTLAGSSEYINSVGVRFTQQNSLDGSEASLSPYGLPCIQELFRFLILLCNPLDKQNTDTMIHMGISLLTVAFEVSADNIGKYDTLLELAKDDLCRHLIKLMSSERLTIFAADLQLCFLLFESLRGHLKFQLKEYLKKLAEIIASDNPKTPYEMRELAVENLLQLWRIPGFVAELYINYDCDLYCSDMFESLTKLLSKYTLSATNAVYSTHILALDALISVIENIERNIIASKNSTKAAAALRSSSSSRHSRHNSELEGIIIDGGATATTPNDQNKIFVENISKFINSSSRLRVASCSDAETAPTCEYLDDVKKKKRVLTKGTECFNKRPEEGIEYLQKNNILNKELDPMEVALFLRENPGLDKKMIGEYISRKKNVDSKILMNFVDSFDFTGLRIDQALRLYLESFRLPGEAALIFLVLEHFADHWHKQNGEPFSNTDAAFSLAYAIIMLNMDQHNSNAKRLNEPMTQEDFLKNLRGVNGGADFDQEMLATVFNAIKNDEIIMPAEQTGIVRENYLWKVLLRRGLGPDGVFNYVHDSVFDKIIFNIIWGPSLSAFSFLFDKSSDVGYQHTLTGFTKSALISAHYNLHENFDGLILMLCKFTTLLTTVQQETTIPPHNEIVQAVNFGLNPKAQAALKVVFTLVRDYGDCLRKSWKNILELFLQLFRLKLLPKSLIEVEDFCEANGKALLILEKPSQKQEVGIFSSLYSYLSSEGQREPSYEEQEFIKIGKKCIKECQLENMIQESKFLQLESLQELLRSVLALIKPPNAHKSIGMPYAEDVVVFWMEFLVQIVIHNRDRMIPLWPEVRAQMYLLLMGSASCGYDYLLNRSIVALLKLAIYLMRNEELCPIVLQSLKMLLMLKPAVVLRISKQISIGIYELLKTSAQNIHSEQDWQIIFTILECVGAGAVPPKFEDAALPVPLGTIAKSDGTLSSEEDSLLSDRGFVSDTEVNNKYVQQQQQQQQYQAQQSNTSSPTVENWILVNKETDLTTQSRPQSPPTPLPPVSPLIYNCTLIDHSPFALFKCWDSLVFIVRNVAHITPYNFESCVRCIRTFVEACRDGGLRQRTADAMNSHNGAQKKRSANKRTEREAQQRKAANTNEDIRSVEAEDDDLAQRYETLSIQLLDLMYTLYTRTAKIFRWWAEEGCAVPQCSALWAQGWCPLLQGIARLAMDRRREVRTYAISCLQQRALLVHDLQTLSGAEWASCFQQVLFPLLNELLPESPSVSHLDLVLLEESRIRTATIMSKVFLHHLTPLIELEEAFSTLWIEILDYIEKFMKVGSDMLSEQMQEILKNMLLVMHSVRVFHNNDGTLHLPLWELTWQRIGEFLPQLKDELFRDEGNRAQVMAVTNTNSANANNKQSNANIALLPHVAILPQQQHQQQQQQFPPIEHIVSQTPIVSPIESPRHSIILQPPAVDTLQRHSFILEQQLKAAPNAPFLLQRQQQQQPSPTVSPTSLYNTANCIDPHLQQTPRLLVQPIPVLATAATTAATSTELPHLNYDATNNIDEPKEAVKQETAANESKHNGRTYSFSIELPATPPETNVYGELTTEQEPELPAQANDEQQEKIETQENSEQQQQQLQQHYELYYQQYQERFNLQQLQYQQQQQQQPQQTRSQAEQQTKIENEQSYFATTAEVPTNSELTSPISNLELNNIVNVPTSHLLAGSGYPSLTTSPNSAIVQSFTPIYVQAQAQHSGAEIYQEYVENPYNLTLQQQQQQQQQKQQQQQQVLQQHQLAQQFNNIAASQQPELQHHNHFNSSPAKYFNTSVEPSSEMFYRQT